MAIIWDLQGFEELQCTTYYYIDMYHSDNLFPVRNLLTGVKQRTDRERDHMVPITWSSMSPEP